MRRYLLGVHIVSNFRHANPDISVPESATLLLEVKLFVHIRDNLVVDFGHDDALHLDVNEVIEGVNVLLEKASDFKKGRDELVLLLRVTLPLPLENRSVRGASRGCKDRRSLCFCSFNGEDCVIPHFTAPSYARPIQPLKLA